MNHFKTDSEQYLRDFFDNAPFGFHVFGPDQIIMDINKTELDLLGYDYDEVVGQKKWTDLISESQKPLFEEHWKTIKKQGTVKNFQYTLKRKDGSLVYVLLYATARFNAEGQLLNTRGIVIDLTQTKEMEKALAFAKQQMKEQEVIFQEKNLALNDVLSRLAMEKNQYSENVTINIEQIVMPLIEKLKRKGSPLDRKNIDLLESSIRQLMSNFGNSLTNTKIRLTAREIEICNMIKNGFTTKKIADTLSVSHRTIDNHRNNIRKKLNISQEKLQLAGYLKSLSDDVL